MSLGSLGLSSNIVQSLQEQGYKSATPIQAALIPAIFKGQDIMAGAQTGTGKTAGFALPILHSLAQETQGKHRLKALVIVPTRELANQVFESFKTYGKYLSLRTVVLYGGANMTTQANRLRAGADIVVATPGRLVEHLERKNLHPEMLRYLVLDEADTILDMGFMNEIRRVVTFLPLKRQTILISATLSGSVKRLANETLVKPLLIEVDSMGTSSKNVELFVYPVEKERKMELLSYVIGSRNYQKVLVFVRKKEEADKVVQELNLSGLKSMVIHGDKSSGARKRALEAFKEGHIRILVATDIAARGLDIADLEVVMNYDIPHVIGDFVHRIGRTGRAGQKGIAITLVAPQEAIALRDVEQLLGKQIKRVEIEDYAPKKIKEQKGARQTQEKKKVDGAFGNKKKSVKTGKKRKTTKRDGFIEKPKNAKKSQTRSKRR